ncbi:MAG: ACP S-malonyltransferase [Bacteroidetes bacterium]|nr:ACP S-malonyltransferase [Bacteroidota bacterium]
MPGFNGQFNEYLFQAAGLTDPQLAGFNFGDTTFPDDELRTQYVTYIYSCAVSKLLRKSGHSPAITAGYSMGIYAALFDSGSVTFETGLALIRIAYQTLHKSLNDKRLGMGTIIGLCRNDIQQLILQSSLRVEIANQNASHSFVVSGYRDDLQNLLEMATEEGALHTRDMSVNISYHSGFMKEGAMDFARQISNLEITAPETPMISLIDQIFLSNPEIIRKELMRNLYHPLNWLETMQVILEKKVSTFIECGPSTGLARNARFVDGIRFFPLSSMLS